MSNPKASTEAKIVDAVMEELRELEPVSQVLDGLRDEQDSVLRTSLADRVHEHVEPYRVSERALRDIVKSLAEQNGQTPVRAEVAFGEKSAAITVSMPTLTPEREAHFAQSICSTIGGLLGLTLGKVKSFGTDAEHELQQTPFGPSLPGFVQPDTDITFMYRGERNWARVRKIERLGTGGRILKIWTVGGGVYDAKDLSDVRLEADPRADRSGGEAAHDVREAGSSEAFMRNLWLLKPGVDVSFRYRGEEHKARVLHVVRRRTASEKTHDLHTVDGSVYDVKAISDVQRLPSVPVVRGERSVPKSRKEYPEIGEKHEFPVLEVVQYLHGHATGSGGGLTQETAQKWATWLEWRITKGWDESLPISAAYDEQIREFAKTVIAMFAGEKPEPLLAKLALLLSNEPSLYFIYDGESRCVEQRSVYKVPEGRHIPCGWTLRDDNTEETFAVHKVSGLTTQSPNARKTV